MAGAGDKARFYLEQYVPELQEYERKQIFTRDEISAIAAKRSDFEHTLNARGSKPSDYATYAHYEMNLDSLRKKRSKRLGVKTTTFSGQRTVFFILDRATRKFPGDMGLWMQYIQFCQKEKANKKLAKVFTSVLRLKPTEYGLWVYAAKHYAETQGDIGTARSYMQRGLRFCRSQSKLWLEYAKLEMVYLAKVSARRRILGLDEQRPEEIAEEMSEAPDTDVIALPEITAEDINPPTESTSDPVNAEALQNLAKTPALTGAIPMAIFDGAMKQLQNNMNIAEEFFELVAEFENVPCARQLLQHILDHLQSRKANADATMICEARLNLFGIEATSADFPLALGKTLAIIKSGLFSAPKRASVAEKALLLLTPYLKEHEQLDEGVVAVLDASVNRYRRICAEDLAPGRKGGKTQALT